MSCTSCGRRQTGPVHGSQAIKRAAVIQKQSGRPVQFEFTPGAREASEAWVGELGLGPAEYGTHSLRRCKATLVYRRARNLRAVQRRWRRSPRVAPRRCYVNRGYRGAAVSGVSVYRSGQRRGVNTRQLKRELRRRSAIEAVIGHMKVDGRMDRCRLKGALGDALHAVLCAAGHNIRLLLRHLAVLFAAHCAVAGLGEFPANHALEPTGSDFRS